MIFEQYINKLYIMNAHAEKIKGHLETIKKDLKNMKQQLDILVITPIKTPKTSSQDRAKLEEELAITKSTLDAQIQQNEKLKEDLAVYLAQNLYESEKIKRLEEELDETKDALKKEIDKNRLLNKLLADLDEYF